MILTVKQGTKDTKEEYLDFLDSLEEQGFIVFDIKCYDKVRKLSEATVIKDKDDQLNNTYISQDGLN